MEVLFIASNKSGNLVNRQIRCKEIFLIGPNGEKLGSKSLNDALLFAETAGFDLVLLTESNGVGTCKLMDYSKYKYERNKKQKEAKKIQRSKNVEIKEFRLTHKIDKNDFDTKLKNARKALEKGNKVKVSMRFKGREIVHNNLGKEVMDQFANELSDISIVETSPKMEGRSMFMMLAPSKDTE